MSSFYLAQHNSQLCAHSTDAIHPCNTHIVFALCRSTCIVERQSRMFKLHVC